MITFWDGRDKELNRIITFLDNENGNNFIKTCIYKEISKNIFFKNMERNNIYLIIIIYKRKYYLNNYSRSLFIKN